MREEESTWEEIYAQQNARYRAPMVVLDGTLYVMGGRGNNGAHRSNEKNTGSGWSYIANQYASDEMCNHCLIPDEDSKEIYQLGGYAWTVGNIDRIVKYYPSSNTWGYWRDSYAGMYK